MKSAFYYAQFILIFVFSGLFSLFGQTMSLEQAIQAGLENNFDFKVSKIEWKQNKESNTYGMAGFLPNLMLSGSRGFQWNDINQRFASGLQVERPGVATNQINASLGLNWVLYDGGRMFIAKRRLEQQVQISETRLKGQVQNLIDSISSAYYQLVALNQELDLTRSEIARTDERLKLATEQFRLGIRSKSDQLMAQIDVNRARNKEKLILLNISDAKGRFNQLIGRNPEVAFEVNADLPPVEPADYQQLKQIVLEKNLALQVQKEGLTMQKLIIRELKSRALPQVALNSGYNFARTNNQAGFALFNQSLGPSVSIGATVPLFQGVSVNRMLRLADFDYQMLEIRSKMLESSMLLALWRAALNLEMQLATMKSEEQNAQLALENFNIVKGRFALGQATSLELKEAELGIVQARQLAQQAHLRAKINQISIQRLQSRLEFGPGISP